MRLAAALLCVLLPASAYAEPPPFAEPPTYQPREPARPALTEPPKPAHIEPPTTAYAEPPEPQSHNARWRDPEVALGLALLGGGYAGALVWGSQREGNRGALYVPTIGPFIELFTMHDCGHGSVSCEHGTSSRMALVLSGIAQLVGTGFLVHGLVVQRDERFLLAPSMTSGNPGISISGRF
jgi:hypothetical protein